MLFLRYQHYINSYTEGFQKLQNKINNNFHFQMNLTSDSSSTRKKLEDYSYLLNNNIGKGYSSQVFKGRNDITNQTVAIKVIDMKMIKGQVHKNLLASQIQVLKTLKNSQNIIEVYDIYTTKNNTYIITELCQGGDLAKIINNRKTLPQAEAISLMAQIINGYNHISNRGIIHRDLKPANIFLKTRQIKIADFGFAVKSADSKKYSSYNVGSPIYMPPEALNDNKYSYKSDIWALGVIFYEMLTGKTPWRAKTEKQLGRQLLSVPIGKLLPKNLSNSSIDFLTKTLEININQRMSPEEISVFRFSPEKTDKNSTKCDLTSSNSISQNKNLLKPNNSRNDTSLNRNTVNTPKNIKRFNFLKGTTQQVKNVSLPKTATTVSTKTQYLISPTNQNINPVNFSATHKQLANFRSTNNIQSVDKKSISKQLLSQIHFCRFLYKLVMRIQGKLSPYINSEFANLKCMMSGLVFDKLQEVQHLKLLHQKQAKQYKISSDFSKIMQIVNQYQSKYNKDMGHLERSFNHYQELKILLTQKIVFLHSQLNNSPSQNTQKEQVIVLDYLITLRQLLGILQHNDMDLFHNKSKMQQIVQGAPAQTITPDHICAITNKLRSIKIL